MLPMLQSRNHSASPYYGNIGQWCFRGLTGIAIPIMLIAGAPTS